MSLRLEVSFNRKLGEPNFGSRGAGLTLSVEAEASLIDRPDALRARVAELYSEVRRAVDRELQLGAGVTRETNATERTDVLEPEPSPFVTNETRPATDEQVRAIFAIGRRTGRNLYRICRERFGKAQPRELSSDEAGQLLDEIDRRVPLTA